MKIAKVLMSAVMVVTFAGNIQASTEKPFDAIQGIIDGMISSQKTQLTEQFEKEKAELTEKFEQEKTMLQKMLDEEKQAHARFEEESKKKAETIEVKDQVIAKLEGDLREKTSDVETKNKQVTAMSDLARQMMQLAKGASAQEEKEKSDSSSSSSCSSPCPSCPPSPPMMGGRFATLDARELPVLESLQHFPLERILALSSPEKVKILQGAIGSGSFDSGAIAILLDVLMASPLKSE